MYLSTKTSILGLISGLFGSPIELHLLLHRRYFLWDDVFANFVEYIIFYTLFSQYFLQAVNSLGFVNPTPIQARTIPIALLGKDICASAATGTGKTCPQTITTSTLIYLQKQQRQYLQKQRCLLTKIPNFVFP